MEHYGFGSRIICSPKEQPVECDRYASHVFQANLGVYRINELDDLIATGGKMVFAIVTGRKLQYD
jgi:hypothetical protein